MDVYKMIFKVFKDEQHKYLENNFRAIVFG